MFLSQVFALEKDIAVFGPLNFVEKSSSAVFLLVFAPTTRGTWAHKYILSYCIVWGWHGLRHEFLTMRKVKRTHHAVAADSQRFGKHYVIIQSLNHRLQILAAVNAVNVLAWCNSCLETFFVVLFGDISVTGCFCFHGPYVQCLTAPY